MRYWKRVDKDGNTTTVESYSHNLDVEGALEITKEECGEFIASLPKPVIEPVRDLAAEIDELRAGQSETNEKVDRNQGVLDFLKSLKGDKPKEGA